MLNKKTIIALLVVLTMGVAVIAGIQVKQYYDHQRVLKEAKDAADKEHKEWQEIGNRSNEEIKKRTGGGTGFKGDL